VMALGLGLLIAAGVVHSVFSTLNQALVQLNSGEAYRARMLGLYSMTGGIEPFSLLVLGVIIEALDVSTAMGVYAGMAAAITLVLALRETLARRPAPPAAVP
jgi:hypothetical protein